MKLDKVLTVGEVAALAGWHRRRMLRRLLRLHAERPLLVNVGTERRPRWTVTLGRLQEVAPQWFVDDETIEARLESIEADTIEMRAKLEAVIVRVGALARSNRQGA